MSTNTGGGTTTSFNNTPQAKDDYYKVDQSKITFFNVMENDLGGNAKVMYSIDNSNDDGYLDLLDKSVVGAVEYSEQGAEIWILADGRIAYNSAKFDYLGTGQTITDQFTYAIRLSNGTLSWATVTVTVTGTNDKPIARADIASVLEDATVTGSVATNDSDVDQNAVLTYSLNAPASAPTGLTFNADGSWSFDASSYDSLAKDQTQQLVIAYTVTDQHGASSSSTLTITITGTNDGPVAVADTGAITENETKSFDVLANDTDVDDNHVFTLVSASAPAGKGTASVVAGQVQFAPGSAFDHLAKDATELVIVSYTMRDEHGAESASTLTITVTGTNDGPVAVADTGDVSENQTASFDVLANDTDVDDGHAFTLLSASAPAGKGTASVVAGQVQFAPGTAFDHLAKDATEQVVVSYTMRDEHGAESTSTLTITVTGTNDAPVVTGAVTGEATEDGSSVSLSALANASDVDDGAVLSVVNVPAALPAGVSYNAVTSQFTLNPAHADYQHLAAGATVVVTVNYGVSDGLATTAASVSWTVTGTNDAPVVSGAVTGDAIEDGSSVSLNALANASDVDDGAMLSVVNVPAVLPAGVSYDAVTGQFTLDPAHAAYQSLASGGTTTVTVNYGVSDGTATTPASVKWTVTGVNDAPVLDAAKAVALNAIDEDAAVLTATGTLVSALVDSAMTPGGLDNVFDVDAGAVTGIAVTGLDSSNGTWFYSLDNGASWLSVGAVSASSALLLSSTARLFFEPNANYNGTLTNAVTFRAWDQTSGVAGTKVVVGAGGGTSAFSTASDSASLIVNAVNDAPVLDASKAVALNAVDEDAAVLTATGTLVSALVDSAMVPGGLDNVIDVDAGAVTGIAITGLDSSNGTWFYSLDNGASWLEVGAVSASQALLLGSNARLFFEPNPNFNGTLANAVTFRAWDQTSGVEGTKVAVGAGGGTSAFSTASDSASLIVNAVNDAPVLDASKVLALNAIDEDAAVLTATGTLVSALVDSAMVPGGLDNVFDVDASAVTGIAITGLDSSNGTWFYSLDNGGSWLEVGTVSASQALLLGSNARLFFEPAPNFNGTLANAVTFRAWDQTSGVEGTKVAVGAGGGTSAFSTASDSANLIVNAVNDAPMLDANKSPELNAINEDAAAPTGAVGTLVSNLVDFAVPASGNDNVMDVDTGALLGIAVTGVNSANGTWYYSLDGGTIWQTVGAVSDSQALLLGTNSRLYFQPAANYEGTMPDAVTFRAWDRSSGVPGAKVDTSANGGTTAFSTATDTASLKVNAVNDAPVLLTGLDLSLNGIDEDAAAPSGAVGTLVSSLADSASIPGGVDNVTDVDAGAVVGIAVTGLNSAHGTWFYSLDGGANWLAVGAVSSSQALLLGANARLYFQPAPNYNGTLGEAITFRAWDQTSGIEGTKANPGPFVSSGAFSSASDTASLNIAAVNDAPTAVVSANQSYTEDTAMGLVGFAVGDIDGDALVVTLTLSNPAAGSLNTGTAGGVTSTYNPASGVWTASGPASAINTLLASLIFTPMPNGNSSFTITTVVSDGMALPVVRVTNVTGIPVNDAPTATNMSAAEAYTEDQVRNLTDIVVGDVDGDQLTVTLTLSNPAVGSLSTATAGAATSQFNAATGVWSVTGSAADVNGLLENVAFTPAPNFNGSFTIATSVSDGVAPPVTGVKAMIGTPVNDAATAINMSAAESYTEDQVRNLTDIVVSDIDGDPLTVTLTLSNPAVGSLSTATVGGATSQFDASTGVWSVTGSAADVNALLASVAFTPAPNFNGNFTIATSVSDGVAPAVTGVKAMTGTPVNDAPTAINMSSAESYTEDQALNLIDIVVADVDSNVTVTLTLSNTLAGSLSQGTVSGVSSTFNPTTGVWSASGSVAAVNALLASVVFTPSANFNGNFTIATSVSDGIAPPITGTKVIAGIPVNDAPTISVNLAGLYTVGGPAVAVDPDIQIADVDSSQLTGATVQITGNFHSGDVLSVTTVSGISATYDPATGLLTLSGLATLAQYEAVMESIKFSSSSISLDQRTITYLVTDSAGATSAPDTGAILVSPPATQPPVLGDDSWALSDNTVIAAGVITPDWFLHDDVDPEGSPLYITNVTGLPPGLVANYDAAGHLVSVTGTTPLLGQAFGNYTLSYEVTDGLTTSTGTVYLLIVDTTANTDIIGLGARDYSYIDLLSGGDTISGATTLMGTLGRDTFMGNNGSDKLYGGAGEDNLFGNENNDELYGETGNDRLDGGNNDDLLDGGTGNDVLTGGAGRDKFQFTSSGAANADTVTDFDQSNNSDLIGLSAANFGAIGAILTGDEFRSNAGGNAVDANDYILFDSTTGNLFYDADGSGGGAKVLIATLTLVGGANPFDQNDFFVF